MIINCELFAHIDSENLLKILNNNISLKNLVDLESEKAIDDIAANQGHKCGGCCGIDSSCGCSQNKLLTDTSYLTSALMAIFNYYIPDDIKNAIHMGGTTFIGDETINH